MQEQEVPVQLTAVMQAAVHANLAERGNLQSSGPLRIRPAQLGMARAMSAPTTIGC
ncbi:MAG: hypothetical protein KDK91_25780 [Gammaproteobacteria bacterium]|nr:hypothetical protein [Gammaproteobacteria bacterium]